MRGSRDRFTVARFRLTAIALCIGATALSAQQPAGGREPATDNDTLSFYRALDLEGQAKYREAATLFRQSHLKRPQIWVESPMSPAAAGAYADLTKATFERRQAVFALRISGRAEYLAALDEAVRAAVKGEKAPAVALRDE